MATTLLRSGIRSFPRLRLDQVITKRHIRTQNVLRKTEDIGGEGGRTFRNAIRENTPKSEYHNSTPDRVRAPVAAVLLALAGAGAYWFSQKDVKAASPPSQSSTKKLPIYRKDEVAKHKTKDAGIWE